MSNAAPATGGQGASALRGAPTPAPAAAPATGASPEWLGGLNDEQRGYVQNKGWKDPMSLLTSYQNLEKLHGAPPDRIIRLPEKPDDPEWANVWGKLGRPEAAAGYKIPEGMAPEAGAAMAEIMFKANAPAELGEKVLSGMREFFSAQATAANEKFAQESEVAMGRVREAWGQKFDGHMVDAQRGVEMLGLSEGEVDALERIMGTERMLRKLQSIGAMGGEHTFKGDKGGRGSDFGYTPEAAKARIAELQKDKGWVQRYAAGGVTEKEELVRLNKIALGQGA